MFKPVIVKDRNTLNAEIQAAEENNKRLRDNLRDIEHQNQQLLAAKLTLERENKTLKEENERLERPLDGQDLEVMQPELLEHIAKIGELISRVGKPNMWLYMVPSIKRSDRLKHRRQDAK